MKKIIAITLVFMITVGLCFAESDGKATSIPVSSKANLMLNLDSDKYLIGFSKTNNYTSMEDDVFELTETVNDDFSVSLLRSDANALYMFYKVLTDSATVKVKLNIDKPLYYNDATTSDTNKIINYKVELSKAGMDWKGEAFNEGSIVVESSADDPSVTLGIRDESYTSYLTYGACKVYIYSTENLSSKVPGIYKSTMTISLISE